MFKTALLAATAAAAMLAGSADAALYIRAYDNGVLFANTTLGTTPIESLITSNTTFTISATALALVDPGFSTQLITMSSMAGLTSSHQLIVELTQTGLTSTGSTYSTTNTLNTLSGPGGTAQAFLGNGAQFDTSAGSLALLTCAAGTSCGGTPVITTLAHGATYDETVRYTFNFGASTGTQSVQASTQIAAAAVPESATWAMMLVGFGAIGGALRTSRRKVVFA